MKTVQAYGTEYEAFYRLISVQESAHCLWDAWCSDPECKRDGNHWSAFAYGYESARQKGLDHCVQVHVSRVAPGA